MLQRRPIGGDRRFYAPGRDLANCGPKLIKAAMDRLLDEPWPAWLGDWLEHNKVTKDQILDAAYTLIQVWPLVPDTSVDDYQAALIKVGADKIDKLALAPFLMMIGLMFLPAAFTAKRDVTEACSAVPTDVCELVDAANATVAFFRRTPGAAHDRNDDQSRQESERPGQDQPAQS